MAKKLLTKEEINEEYKMHCMFLGDFIIQKILGNGGVQQLIVKLNSLSSQMAKHAKKAKK